jgi:hypothetical protein
MVNWTLAWPGVGIFVGATGSTAFFALGLDVAGLWCLSSGIWACFVFALAWASQHRIRPAPAPVLSLMALVSFTSTFGSLLALVLYCMDGRQRIDSRIMQSVWCFANIRWSLALGMYSRRAASSESLRGDDALLLEAAIESTNSNINSDGGQKIAVDQRTQGKARCVRAITNLASVVITFLLMVIIVGCYGALLPLVKKQNECSLGPICNLVLYPPPPVKK